MALKRTLLKCRGYKVKLEIQGHFSKVDRGNVVHELRGNPRLTQVSQDSHKKGEKLFPGRCRFLGGANNSNRNNHNNVPIFAKRASFNLSFLRGY